MSGAPISVRVLSMAETVSSFECPEATVEARRACIALGEDVCLCLTEARLRLEAAARLSGKTRAGVGPGDAGAGTAG